MRDCGSALGGGESWKVLFDGESLDGASFDGGAFDDPLSEGAPFDESGVKPGGGDVAGVGVRLRKVVPGAGCGGVANGMVVVTGAGA